MIGMRWGQRILVNLVTRKVHTCCSMKCLKNIFNILPLCYTDMGRFLIFTIDVFVDNRFYI
ncbi:hypothetical protein HanHA89_Chr14g0584741 [Helianthus annuus]|nr:hypothetical protein HanHA89_Chr14g0584741 [Helianthus annuus]